MDCNVYLNFGNGAHTYLAWPWSPSCGSGLAGDFYSETGCSPTNGTQSGKDIGNDTCDCGGPNSTGAATGGEPIDIGSGNVSYHFADYTTAGQNPLQFTRYYNSRTNFSGTLGPHWQSNFDRYIYWQTGDTFAIVQRPNGQQLVFNLVSSVWTPDSDVDYKLTQSGSTWTLTTPDDSVETYTTASSGYVAILESIVARNGYTQTLTYTSTLPQQLSSVTDSYNRTLTFAYNTNGTIASVETPDSTTITFGYTSTSDGSTLTSVAYPTSPASSVTYAYGNSSLPSALTSITDEDGNTYQSWTYDAYGRGLTSAFGGSSLNANLTTIAYNDTNVTRTVTNALGVTDTYTFTTVVNVPKLTQISRAATSTTAAATESFGYDSNGYLNSITDWNANQTTLTNNTHGLPTTINEAVGSSVARTTTIVYDATWVHLPDSITTPGLTTSFTYDSDGDVLTKTLTDTTSQSVPYSTNGQTRTWTNTWSNFLLASVKNPNGNTTTFGYSSTGALTSVTDALSHVWSITSHTGGGLPETVIDPNGSTNGATTTLTYDARQRLTQQSVATQSGGTETATYTLDAAGNLTKLTLPDSSYISNVYDTAHRLTQATNALGEYQKYTLDALGDWTQVNTYDSSNNLWRQQARTFDALGREIKYVGGSGLDQTTFTYDANSNQLTITDGNSHTTTRVFDALNRLSKSTDANSGVTQLAYDAHDRPTTVTDANSNATNYVYDGFGDAIQLASPDNGTWVSHYDGDANLSSRTDALGNSSSYTYDALDRLTHRTNGSAQWAYFGYDGNGTLGNQAKSATFHGRTMRAATCILPTISLATSITVSTRLRAARTQPTCMFHTTS